MKTCYVVSSNSYGHAYPTKAFLNKETAVKYKESQEKLDTKSTLRIDSVYLDEM